MAKGGKYTTPTGAQQTGTKVTVGTPHIHSLGAQASTHLGGNGGKKMSKKNC